ncbi:MAG: hypothetical protein AB8B95_02135 [Pseudohongiellaceae bacterium]
MTNRKTWLLALTLLILLFAVVVLGWGIIRKTQFDTSSASFATNIVETLFAANGIETLGEVVNNGSFSAESQERLVGRISSLKRLVGSLESINGVFGGAEVPLIPFKEITASYDLDLRTRAGQINANLVLAWLNDAWTVQKITFSGAPLQG